MTRSSRLTRSTLLQKLENIIRHFPDRSDFRFDDSQTVIDLSNENIPDDSSQPPKTVAQSSIDRKRGHSSRFGDLGWATRRIRAHVKVHWGARKRSFGKRRAPGPRWFNPAAMTRRVMSAPASAADRRSFAGFPRTVAVESRPRQAGTSRAARG